MEKLYKLFLLSVAVTLCFAVVAKAEVIEPIFMVNIASDSGEAGHGAGRALISYDAYEDDWGNDYTQTAVQAEFNYYISNFIAAGIQLPYDKVDSKACYSYYDYYYGRTYSNCDNNDENGLGNLRGGAHIVLDIPQGWFEPMGLSEKAVFVVGGNVTLPTGDDDVLPVYTAIQPYATIEMKKDKYNMTSSASYEIIIDEKHDYDLDNTLSLQGSMLYEIDELFSAGAQLIINMADKTAVDLVPQALMRQGKFDAKVAITLPVINDYPQGGGLEKKYGIAIEGGYAF